VETVDLWEIINAAGGVWTVAAFGLRVANRAQKEVVKAVGLEKDIIPSSLPASKSSDNIGSGWLPAGKDDHLGSGTEWKRR